MVGNSREPCDDFEWSSPSLACCFLLGKGARSAIALSSDSHLLRRALLESSASTHLTFLNGAWSVTWRETPKWYMPVPVPCISLWPTWNIDKQKPQSHSSNISVGLHRRRDEMILISRSIYIGATSLTSASGMSLRRWASELSAMQVSMQVSLSV